MLSRQKEPKMNNNKSIKKITGSFYTCSSVAEYIAKWAIKNKNDSLLEPSFGDGSFLDAAIKVFNNFNNKNPNINGVELQKEPYYSYKKSNPIIKCFLSDFMDYIPSQKFDVAIGNPPYVSLKKLKEEARNKALNRIKTYNLAIPSNCSMWMPFIIHATELLNNKGRLGFVLPYEIAYVRYAFPLWKYLCKKYGKLTIIRIFDDFFPEVDVETIIFLAADKGDKTDEINYFTFNNVSDLFHNKPQVSTKVKIDEILMMNKPFEQKLIPDAAQKIFEKLRLQNKLGLLKNECKFKIGYVCGNKEFFHPNQATIKKFGLKKNNLIPCILNAKEINTCYNLGIDTNTYQTKKYLFCPTKIDNKTIKYISYGEKKEIHLGYKCSKRKPWYKTPGIEIPDIILTVFGDTPRLLTNSKRYVVSNSLLSGIISTSTSSKNVACRWYNSLTLLMIELMIHSLGGGSLVIIPGEIDKLEFLRDFPEKFEDNIFKQFNEYIIKHGFKEAYNLGDEIVLKNIYKLSNKEINTIKKSLDILQKWRNPENRR